MQKMLGPGLGAGVGSSNKADHAQCPGEGARRGDISFSTISDRTRLPMASEEYCYPKEEDAQRRKKKRLHPTRLIQGCLLACSDIKVTSRPPPFLTNTAPALGSPLNYSLIRQSEMKDLKGKSLVWIKI